MKTTRREALGLIGIATGAAMISPLLGKAALAVDGGNGERKTSGKTPKASWPYEKLDPVAVAERAYAGYYVGRCMYGVFFGIVGELAARKGSPYDAFPFDMMKYGEGGVLEWGTLCGALNGAAAAIYLLSGDPKPLIDEVFGWSQEATLPDYRPAAPKFIIAPSAAKSTLCHMSVSRWCKVTGFKSFSRERVERCAWMTASVARKTVEILNRQHAGTFMPAYPVPGRVQECRACHDKGGILENTRGKMDCAPCHSNLGTEHKKI